MRRNMKNTITEGQVSHWKAQYGSENVKIIEVPLEDPKVESQMDNSTGMMVDVLIPPPIVTGYFRKPDLKVIQAAAPFLDSDPVKAGLIQFENCFLGGDPEFSTNDEVRFSAIQALNKLFRVRVATIKNA